MRAPQYQGSLTTAPCSQSTTWVILKTPMQISTGNLEVIKNKQQSNNRAIQALNGRQVYDAHPDTPIPTTL